MVVFQSPGTACKQFAAMSLLMVAICFVAPCVSVAQLSVDLGVEVTDRDGVFSYAYTLTNSSDSLFSINAFTIDLGAQANPTTIGPPGWISDFDPNQSDFELVWIAEHEEDEVAPGDSALFTISSLLAPEDLDFFVANIVGESAVAADSGVISAPGRPNRLRADFNRDGLVNGSDIDLLTSAIPTGQNDIHFDLTGDAQVNADDLSAFLALVNRLPGDADLDGAVQFNDFVALATNFGTAGTWSQGDFDASANVQFSDFVILANRFGASSSASTAVPEPCTSWMLLVTLVWEPLCRRRRRRLSTQRVGIASSESASWLVG